MAKKQSIKQNTKNAEVERVLIEISRANDDIKYASSTNSETTRKIGFGLAAVSYGLLISSDKNQIIQNYLPYFIVASVCGLLTIVADFLQYYFMAMQKANTATALHDALNRNETPGREEILKIEDTAFLTIRNAMYYTKITFAGLGTISILIFLVLLMFSPAS